jgi:hypothetical protein
MSESVASFLSFVCLSLSSFSLRDDDEELVRTLSNLIFFLPMTVFPSTKTSKIDSVTSDPVGADRIRFSSRTSGCASLIRDATVK